jgi:hypothetical protein
MPVIEEKGRGPRNLQSEVHFTIFQAILLQLLEEIILLPIRIGSTCTYWLSEGTVSMDTRMMVKAAHICGLWDGILNCKYKCGGTSPNI